MGSAPDPLQEAIESFTRQTISCLQHFSRRVKDGGRAQIQAENSLGRTLREVKGVAESIAQSCRSEMQQQGVDSRLSELYNRMQRIQEAAAGPERQRTPNGKLQNPCHHMYLKPTVFFMTSLHHCVVFSLTQLHCILRCR